MACGTKGWKYQFFVDPNPDPQAYDWNYGTNTDLERHLPVSTGLTGAQKLLEVPGTTGDRGLLVDQAIGGNIEVGGQVKLKISPQELTLWLPRILGGAPIADAYPPDDTIPSFGVLVDKGQARFQYSECKIAKATFSGSAGGLVEMVLDILGKIETEEAIAAPAVPVASATGLTPLRFSGGTLTIDSIACLFDQFTLEIDNGIDPLFYNSETAQCLDEGRRSIMLKLPIAYTSLTKDLYSRGSEGLEADLTFIGAGNLVQFVMPKGKWAGASPVMAGDKETPEILEIKAYKPDMSTHELMVVNTVQ